MKATESVRISMAKHGKWNAIQVNFKEFKAKIVTFKQGMTEKRHRQWNNRGHCNRATVTVKIFLSGGDSNSPVLTVIGRNILIIVERGQKNVGENITHQSAVLADTVTN